MCAAAPARGSSRSPRRTGRARRPSFESESNPRLDWAMDAIRSFLAGIGLPRGDLNELPDSPKRFPDGAQYRIEIPSTEGPRCLEAVLAEAERLDVRVQRVSQGSGVFMQTDDELDEMACLAAEARVEVSLFAR